MATWDEIRQHLMAKHGIDKADDGDGLTFVFEWAGEDRTQALSVSKYDDGQAAWLGLSSTVCSLEQLSSKKALRKNAELAIGALALVDDDYVLTYSLPLAAMHDLAVVDYVVERFATQADTLEQAYAGDDTH
jgi:hypothetical protein